MRAVVQRVVEARVRVDGTVVGEIGEGLLVLVGVTHTDTAVDATALARKVHGLRILRDEQSIAERSDAGRPGRQPVHPVCRRPQGPAAQLVGRGPRAGRRTPGRRDGQRAGALGADVRTGIFGADMRVELVNDGPVTVIIDS